MRNTGYSEKQPLEHDKTSLEHKGKSLGYDAVTFELTRECKVKGQDVTFKGHAAMLKGLMWEGDIPHPIFHLLREMR